MTLATLFPALLLLMAGASAACAEETPSLPANVLEGKTLTERLAAISALSSQNLTNRNGSTVLHLLAAEGRPVETAHAVSLGANPDVSDRKGRHALHIAAAEGHIEVAAVLLSHEASLTAAAASGATPLSEAVHHNHPEMVEYLLSVGADINHISTGTSKASAFLTAAWDGNFRMVELLLKHGATLSISDRVNGYSALSAALVTGNHKLAEFLIRNGADVHQVTAGLSSLHLVRDTKTARLLLKNGVHIQAAGRNGWTPLFAAAERNDLNMLKLFVARDADTSSRDDMGRTALHLPDLTPGTANILIAADANLNARDKTGRTPLMIYASHQNHDTALFVIRKGADVNLDDDRGWTALHHACANGDPEMTTLLLARGATPGLKTGDNKTPRDLAGAGQHQEVLDILDRLKP